MGRKGFSYKNPGGLTPTERKVACLDGLGYQEWEIAYLMQVTQGTVNSHKQTIHNKTGRNKSVHIAQYVRRRGWITEDQEDKALEQIDSQTFQTNVAIWKIHIKDCVSTNEAKRRYLAMISESCTPAVP